DFGESEASRDRARADFGRQHQQPLRLARHCFPSMTELFSERSTVDGGVEGRTQLEFDDNLLLPLLYGERDQHLDRIERQLGVSVITRGNRLVISGPAPAAGTAQLALSRLYDCLKRGHEVNIPGVEAAIRLAAAELADKRPGLWGEEAAFRTRKRRISARSPR